MRHRGDTEDMSGYSFLKTENIPYLVCCLLIGIAVTCCFSNSSFAGDINDGGISASRNDSAGPEGEQTAFTLSRRDDDMRPDDQITLSLFGRPLTVGGEYNAKLSYRGDFELDDAEEDNLLTLGQKLEIEFLYDMHETASLFLELKPFYINELYAEDNNDEHEAGVERGEMWIYSNRLFTKHLALQAGRQNFDEKREWWWDEDLDAVRMYLRNDNIRIELAVAEELYRTSTEDDDIDPEEEDVLRLLGRAVWKWGEKRRQRLEIFFLSQNDYSDTESEGAEVDGNKRDESDADLVWLGFRSMGRWKVRPAGRFYYWFDAAFVTGEETLIDYDRIDGSDRREVDDVELFNVDGWGMDTGITWRTEFPAEPSMTIGYAYGSGDRDPEDRHDRSFRQTGLHDNNARFRGVNSFRYYGELLRPELSNIHILTLAAGLPVLKESSVELVYHRYWQDHAASFLRDTRIEAKPFGKDNSLGDEWDVIVGIEEWKHVELEIIGALFRAGDAFAVMSGETAFYASFEFTYNF